MKNHRTLLSTLSLSMTLVACGSDETDVNSTPQPLCSATELASDFEVSTLLGPMGDPANWPAMPPTSIVSTTYLQLQGSAESSATFDQLMGPIISELMAPAPGLMGLSFSSSAECGNTRTLAVWESEDAMMDFVLGTAHSAAISRVAEVSRGGSITSHWNASEFDALTWANVAANLAGHNGPVY